MKQFLIVDRPCLAVRSSRARHQTDHPLQSECRGTSSLHRQPRRSELLTPKRRLSCQQTMKQYIICRAHQRQAALHRPAESELNCRKKRNISLTVPAVPPEMFPPQTVNPQPHGHLHPMAYATSLHIASNHRATQLFVCASLLRSVRMIDGAKSSFDRDEHNDVVKQKRLRAEMRATQKFVKNGLQKSV